MADEKKAKPRRTRGSGSVYLRDGSRFFQIKFYRNGQMHRESTTTTVRKEAQALLDQRLSEVRQNTFNPQARHTTVADLMERVWRDYEKEKRRSLDDAKARWEKHLSKPDAFGNILASEVSLDLIDAYQIKRQKEGAATATINRELALLKRAFKLGKKYKVVSSVPEFSLPKEDNTRLGFIEPAQYDALAAATGKKGLWLRTLFELGYSLGWRIGELRNLKVKQVDLLNRTITLDPGTTKNGEGRTAVLPEAAYQLVLACAVGKQPNDYLISRDGKQVTDFRGSWSAATAEAEVPDLLFHDLRRTAVRNMVRSGIPETVAMKISGHKTRAVFDRYNITSTSDLRDAALKLEQARAAHKVEINTAQKSAQPHVRTQISTQ